MYLSFYEILPTLELMHPTRRARMNSDLATVSRLYEITMVGVACGPRVTWRELIRESKAIGIDAANIVHRAIIRGAPTVAARCDSAWV